MSLLIINGAPRKRGMTSQVFRFLEEKVTRKYDYFHLSELNIKGCIACGGCVHDNRCKVKDDEQLIREKLLQSNEVLFLGSTMNGGLNSISRNYLERQFQFRHNETGLLRDKVFHIIGVGAAQGEKTILDIKSYLRSHHVRFGKEINVKGPVMCYTCGHGKHMQVIRGKNH